MADSDDNWRLWGERDPYYGVLTDPRFRRDRIADNRELFFFEGQAYVAHWLAELERCFGPVPRGRALDFGCGVGRLTIPLSDHFASVTGLDISEGMLDEARRNSAGRAIEYLLSDDALSRAEGTFDLVTSVIVLQHIPVARGMAILSRLLARVGPGGGCLIQVATKRHEGPWGRLRYAIRHRVPGGQTITNLLGGRAPGTPVMEMNAYPLEDVLALFREHGLADTLVRHERDSSSDSATILARRR
ncbi:MAG: class I SAM-dependent methyltransferase [Erythrobacter sp.]